MRIGAIADVSVDQRDIRLGHIGVQVVAGDHRCVWTHNAAHQREQRSLGVMVCCGQTGAVQHTIDAVEPAGMAQSRSPIRPSGNRRMPGRPVHSARPSRAGSAPVPIPLSIHVGDEARQLAQHMRRSRARIRQHGFATHQGPCNEILLRRNRGKAVAFDREAKQCDARSHSATPRSSAMRGVALRPLPVSTSTVVWSGVIVPAANSLRNAATACADVGST